MSRENGKHLKRTDSSHIEVLQRIEALGKKDEQKSQPNAGFKHKYIRRASRWVKNRTISALRRELEQEKQRSKFMKEELFNKSSYVPNIQENFTMQMPNTLQEPSINEKQHEKKYHTNTWSKVNPYRDDGEKVLRESNNTQRRYPDLRK